MMDLNENLQWLRVIIVLPVCCLQPLTTMCCPSEHSLTAGQRGAWVEVFPSATGVD